MGRRCRVEVSEPLRLYAGGFRAELAKQGHKPLSADQQLRLMAHLGRWLTGEDLELEQLTDRVVARFLRGRRADGYVTFVSVGSLRVVLGYLRDRGVLPVPASGATDTAVSFEDGDLVSEGEDLGVLGPGHASAAVAASPAYWPRRGTPVAVARHGIITRYAQPARGTSWGAGPAGPVVRKGRPADAVVRCTRMDRRTHDG
jgi:hypothetical protein